MKPLAMLNKILYDKCLCCGSSDIKRAFSSIDYTVTKEYFEIWECSRCTFRFTQNVPDAHHIGPYYQSTSYVSHSDTKVGLINKLYHFARSLTLKSKHSLVNKVTGLKLGALLDYGAGTGAFSHFMKIKGWNVTGIEPDDNARSNALKNYNLQLDKLSHLDLLQPSSFDSITLWHVLEHVHDLYGTLEHFQRVLKPSGRLLIAVPNYTSFDAQHYKEYWAAYDVPRHLYHFSPQSMEVLLESKGFVLEKKYPMWFDSIYVSMLSEQYKYGKNNYLGAVWIGMLSNLKALFSAGKCSSVIYVLKKK